MPDILKEIKNPKGRAFRRLYVKRRLASTGLFESDWQELTPDVKAWGTISKSIDAVQYSRVRFSDVNLVMANDSGRYNPEDDDASFWNGYASQQRTLVKIEAGFLHQTLGADGIWTNTYLPSTPTIFIGVLQGDIQLDSSNEVVLPAKPLLQVFRDFSTRNLSGLTTAGMTAAQFIQTLRDQTDGAGSYIFRPFFGDTTANWDYTSSSVVYADLNLQPFSSQPTDTTTALKQNSFLEMNVWEVIEKLAQAENCVPYITRDGKFKFVDRSENSVTAAYGFFGVGTFDRRHGLTIKEITSYKKKTSDYYSRVEVKWNDVATTTAIVETQTSMMVGNNDAWNYGHRTFKVENDWVATVTAARTLASTIFAAVSAVPRELQFRTSFVPHLEVLDLVAVSQETEEGSMNQRWDLNDWAADNTSTASDLIWASTSALSFQGDEFKLTSIAIDLDQLECSFIGIKTGGSNPNVGGNTVGSAIVGDAILG